MMKLGTHEFVVHDIYTKIINGKGNAPIFVHPDTPDSFPATFQFM